MWCVVVFDDNLIRIIRQDWLVDTSDGDFCHYPPEKDTTKLNHFLIKDGPPHPDWPVFKVEVLKSDIDELLAARRIAKKAEDESDPSLTDPEKMGRGCRRKTNKILDSSSDDENCPPTKVPRFKPVAKPSQSLLNVETLNWPSSCIDKVGSLPDTGLKNSSRSNAQGFVTSTQTLKKPIQRIPVGLATSTQKNNERSIGGPKINRRGAANFKTPFKPSTLSSSNAALSVAQRKSQSARQIQTVKSSINGQSPLNPPARPTHGGKLTGGFSRPHTVRSIQGNQISVNGPKNSSAGIQEYPLSSSKQPSAGYQILAKLESMEAIIKRVDKTTANTAAKVVLVKSATDDLPEGLKSIQEKLSELIITEEQNIRESILFNLPIQDADGLISFDTQLMNAKFRTGCITFLATKGSNKSVSLCVKKMMRVILTDELALDYCMTGHKGKASFNDHKLLCEAIGAATRSLHPGATDEEVSKFASEWLTKAHERLTSKSKRRNGVADDEDNEGADELHDGRNGHCQDLNETNFDLGRNGDSQDLDERNSDNQDSDETNFDYGNNGNLQGSDKENFDNTGKYGLENHYDDSNLEGDDEL